METAIWKWGYGDENDHVWRLQTEETHVIRKLKRRNSVSIVAWSDNSNLLYFHLSYTDRFKAMQGLSRLTGREVYYNAVDEVIMTKSTPILHKKKGALTSNNNTKITKEKNNENR